MRRKHHDNSNIKPEVEARSRQPLTELGRSAKKMKPIPRFLVFVVATGSAFGIAGGLIGAVIGSLAPSYYRTVFSSGGNPDFDPLQIGVGLGTSQGLVIGTAVAVALVLASAIGCRGGSGGSGGRLVASRPFWVMVCSIAIALCSGAAFLFGGISGQGNLYNRIVSQKIERIERVLRMNHVATIEIDAGSGGRVSLSGTVASETLKASLQVALAAEFGEKEAQKQRKLGPVIGVPEGLSSL